MFLCVAKLLVSMGQKRGCTGAGQVNIGRERGELSEKRGDEKKPSASAVRMWACLTDADGPPLSGSLTVRAGFEVRLLDRNQRVVSRGPLSIACDPLLCSCRHHPLKPTRPRALIAWLRPRTLSLWYGRCIVAAKYQTGLNPEGLNNGC